MGAIVEGSMDWVQLLGAAVGCSCWGQHGMGAEAWVEAGMFRLPTAWVGEGKEESSREPHAWVGAQAVCSPPRDPSQPRQTMGPVVKACSLDTHPHCPCSGPALPSSKVRAKRGATKATHRLAERCDPQVVGVVAELVGGHEAVVRVAAHLGNACSAWVSICVCVLATTEGRNKVRRKQWPRLQGEAGAASARTAHDAAVEARQV